MGEKLNFKDIAVTPLIIDHSAYDAYMFLIETDNKKVLYTGDFRTHGTRGKAFIPTLLKYVGQVDVLITEGTMLTRAETQITEKKLLDKAKKYLRDFKYVFLICSSTNIDRIGSFHQATPKGKYFICDKYQYDVLLSVRKYAGHLTSLYQYKKALYYSRYLKDKLETRGFCMVVRSGRMFKALMDYYRQNHNNPIDIPKNIKGKILAINNFSDLENKLKYILLSAYRKTKRPGSFNTSLSYGILILSEIRKHPGITTLELATKCSKSQRSVQRYIEAFRNAGEWIKYDNKLKGW